MKPRHNRREFMGLTSAGVAGIVGTRWLTDSRGAEAIPNERAEANPAMAHLFIVNPLSGRGVDNLFSTHPNVENRIAALEELARRMNIAPGSSAGAAGWAPFGRDRFRWGVGLGPTGTNARHRGIMLRWPPCALPACWR